MDSVQLRMEIFHTLCHLVKDPLGSKLEIANLSNIFWPDLFAFLDCDVINLLVLFNQILLFSFNLFDVILDLTVLCFFHQKVQLWIAKVIK